MLLFQKTWSFKATFFYLSSCFVKSSIRGNRLVWFENKYLVVVPFLRSRTHISSYTQELWRPKEMLTCVVTLMLLVYYSRKKKQNSVQFLPVFLTLKYFGAFYEFWKSLLCHFLKIQLWRCAIGMLKPNYVWVLFSCFKDFENNRYKSLENFCKNYILF